MADPPWSGTAGRPSEKCARTSPRLPAETPITTRRQQKTEHAPDGPDRPSNYSPPSTCPGRPCPSRSAIASCETRTPRRAGWPARCACASGGISECPPRWSPRLSSALESLEEIIHKTIGAYMIQKAILQCVPCSPILKL